MINSGTARFQKINRGRHVNNYLNQFEKIWKKYGS